jgi:hypothetical protein
MDFQYAPLSRDTEKSPLYKIDDEIRSISDLEEEFTESSARRGYRRPDGCASQIKWQWLVHVLLILTALTLFLLSLQLRGSTLDHVRRFSAWCEYQILHKRCLLHMLY